MTPREADPNGANSGGGAAGIESDRDVRREGPEGRPQDEAGNETSRVDTIERNVVTSGIAQTSEVADRDAQDGAEGAGDGTPQGR